jgi:hypothetical protein|tara:strand:+ start:115 stop:1008 length:894 start_codon:yes stop_codon:yes gene_type:complete
MTKAGAFEGHPFTVECGLSFGGDKCKEGITVHRFANRIPLLFESGSDVATAVAKDDIKWNNYKLKSKVDKLGIFVSICSTKIPFKGTGKEFISKQNGVYRKAIKSCLFKCANQLKSQIARDRAAGEDIKRRKNIQKFIPKVTTFLSNVLTFMAEREHLSNSEKGSKGSTSSSGRSTRGSHPSGVAPLDPDMINLASKFHKNTCNQKMLEESLEMYVDRMDDQEALQRVASKKNHNISGAVYLPAIDYNDSDLFAGEFSSTKMEFTVLSSVLKEMDTDDDSEDSDDEMSLTDLAQKMS